MEFPFVKDARPCQCVEALGVRRTPEVVVLDESRHVRYHLHRRPVPSKPASRDADLLANDLKEALDAVVAGREGRHWQKRRWTATSYAARDAQAEAVPTYVESVGPILRFGDVSEGDHHRPTRRSRLR